MAALGSPHLDCRQDGAKLDAGRAPATSSTPRSPGSSRPMPCLLIGTNPRWEAPLVNARLRKRYLQGGFTVGAIGAAARSDLSGRPISAPARRRWTSSPTVPRRSAEVLKHAKRPMLILGQGALARPDGAAVLAAARELAERLGLVRDGLERLQRAAHRGGPRRRPRPRLRAGRGRARRRRHRRRRRAGRDRGRLPARRRRDRHRAARRRLRRSTRATTATAARTAPTSSCRAPPTPRRTPPTSTPRAAPQRAKLAVFPPGEAREDWKILRALSEALGRTLPLDTLAPGARAHGRASRRSSPSSTRSCRRLAARSAARASSRARRSRRRSRIST